MTGNSFIIYRKDSALLVSLPGLDFDKKFSSQYKKLIENLLNKYHFRILILDFSKTLLLDGDGIAGLIYTLNVCSSRKINLLLSSPNSSVNETMIQKGLNAIFEITNNLRKAFDLAGHYNNIRQIGEVVSRDISNIFGHPSEENMGISEEQLYKIKEKILTYRKSQ